MRRGLDLATDGLVVAQPKAWEPPGETWELHLPAGYYISDSGALLSGTRRACGCHLFSDRPVLVSGVTTDAAGTEWAEIGFPSDAYYVRLPWHFIVVRRDVLRSRALVEERLCPLGLNTGGCHAEPLLAWLEAFVELNRDALHRDTRLDLGDDVARLGRFSDFAVGRPG